MRRFLSWIAPIFLIFSLDTEKIVSIYSENTEIQLRIGPEVFPQSHHNIAPALIASPFSASAEEIGKLAPYTYQLAAYFEYQGHQLDICLGSAVLVRSGDSSYGITAAHILTYENNSVFTLVKKLYDWFTSKSKSHRDAEKPILAKVLARDYCGTIFTCTVCELIPQLDIATFQINSPSRIRPETIIERIGDEASDDPGEPIYVCGWHSGRFFVQQGQEGTFTSLIRVENLGLVSDTMTANVPIAPGFSGGPVLTTDLRLLGVCSCGKTD